MCTFYCSHYINYTNYKKEHHKEAWFLMECNTLDAFWRILIAFSNVAFAYPVYALSTMGNRLVLWPEISQMTMTGVFSSLYHLCDDANGQEPCYRICVLRYANLYLYDFIFSYQTLAIVAFISTDYKHVVYKCVGMSAYFTSNLSYFTFYSRQFPEWQYTLLMAIITLGFVIVRYDKHLLYSDLRIVPIAILAFACKAMVAYYSLFHALWHIFIAIFFHHYLQVRQGRAALVNPADRGTHSTTLD